MKRKVDDALRELICGILMSGAVIEIIDLIVTGVYAQFSGLRLLFATGLWVGVGVAAALAVHMHRSINRALGMPPEEAEEYMRRAYLVRTVVILLTAAGVHYLRIGYVMAYFVGVLCLNSGAFLQRVLHLIQQRVNKPGKADSARSPVEETAEENSAGRPVEETIEENSVWKGPGECSDKKPSGKTFDNENSGK